jgi:photosystem II stability/assembly factor-like uncharacterized protein
MDDFDRDIRNAFHSRQLPGAPVNLLRTLDALPPRHPRPVLGSFRLVLSLAAVLVVLLLAVVAVGGGSPKVPPATSPAPSLPAINGPSAEPSASTAPSPSVEPSVAPAPSIATPSPQSTAPGATPAPAANSGPAGLIDPQHGWVIGDQRLLVTSDGGSTWRDVNPPAPTEPGQVANPLGVQFIDAEHGWVAFAEPFNLGTDPGFGRVDIWRTTNGGQTWAKSELPPAKINNDGDVLGPFSFDFLDANHGFALISGNFAHVLGDSDLYWTADGGRTWSADRPTGPGGAGVEGSSLKFATAKDGVIVGSPEGSGVSVTHDAGTTWKAAVLGAPAGMSGAVRSFGRAVFFDAHVGLLAVQFQGATSSVTRIYRTTDAGSTWTFLSHIPGTDTLHVSILDQQTWIATDGTDVVHTTNGGAGWTHATAQAPVTDFKDGLQDAQFVDLQHGWAQWTDPQTNSHILATSDGGATWRALAP